MTLIPIVRALREQGSVDVVHVRGNVWSVVGQLDVRKLAAALKRHEEEDTSEIYQRRVAREYRHRRSSHRAAFP